MAEGLEIRALSSLEDMREASALIDRVWGERRIVLPALLRALADHGNPVLGAFREERMVGAQMGFLGWEEGTLLLHSHITGVAPEDQHAGIGLELKRAQRAWCLERGIDTVTWTFDPLVARNAFFNLEKLGAVADRFHRDLYGPMNDAFNAGDRSDRLEVRWALRSARVEAALAGRLPEAAAGDAVLVDERAGVPVPGAPSDAPVLVVRIPLDYHVLRRADPGAGAAWRDAVGDALEQAMAAGYRATRFLRDGAYLLEAG